MGQEENKAKGREGKECLVALVTQFNSVCKQIIWVKGRTLRVTELEAGFCGTLRTGFTIWLGAPKKNGALSGSYEDNGTWK